MKLPTDFLDALNKGWVVESANLTHHDPSNGKYYVYMRAPMLGAMPLRMEIPHWLQMLVYEERHDEKQKFQRTLRTLVGI